MTLSKRTALASGGGCPGLVSGMRRRWQQHGHPIHRGQCLLAIPEANAIAAFPCKQRHGQSERRCWVRLSAEELLRSRLRFILPASLFMPPTRAETTFRLFSIDSNTGVLTEVLPRTPAGLNPSALVMDSGGSLLFVANLTSNNISVYSISASDGTLMEAAGSPFPTVSRPVALALSPSAKFLYVASSGLPFVFGYSVASGTGALQPVPGSPFSVGNGPSALLVHPSEQFSVRGELHR